MRFYTSVRGGLYRLVLHRGILGRRFSDKDGAEERWRSTPRASKETQQSETLSSTTAAPSKHNLTFKQPLPQQTSKTAPHLQQAHTVTKAAHTCNKYKPCVQTLVFILIVVLYTLYNLCKALQIQQLHFQTTLIPCHSLPNATPLHYQQEAPLAAPKPSLLADTANPVGNRPPRKRPRQTAASLSPLHRISHRTPQVACDTPTRRLFPPSILQRYAQFLSLQLPYFVFSPITQIFYHTDTSHKADTLRIIISQCIPIHLLALSHKAYIHEATHKFIPEKHSRWPQAPPPPCAQSPCHLRPNHILSLSLHKRPSSLNPPQNAIHTTQPCTNTAPQHSFPPSLTSQQIHPTITQNKVHTYRLSPPNTLIHPQHS